MSRDSLESLRRFSPYLASRFLLNLGRILSRRFHALTVTTAPDVDG